MTKHLNAAILVCLSTAFFLAGSARAGYVNLTGAENSRNIAEIRVENDRVKVTLEIFVEDLGKFLEILPDEFFEGSDVKPPPLEVRMRRFTEETFRVTADGSPLEAKLLLSEPRMRTKRDSPFAGMINPYTRQSIPGPPEDPRVLFAEIVYPFEGRPAKLEFSPPRVIGDSPQLIGALRDRPSQGAEEAALPSPFIRRVAGLRFLESESGEPP